MTTHRVLAKPVAPASPRPASLRASETVTSRRGATVLTSAISLSNTKGTTRG
jgi:hypothetical protein